MREIIDIVEGRKIEVDLGDYELPFKVSMNPSAREMDWLMADRLRAIIDDSGDFYVWDAYKGTHTDVAHALGVHIDNGFDITRKVIRDAWIGRTSKALTNRNFMRAFNNKPPPFTATDYEDNEPTD